MRRCALLLPLFLAAGCSTDNATVVVSTTPVVKRLPPCAGTMRALAAPPSFPRSFPLPKGTRIMSTSRQSGGTIITGAIPTGTLASTANELHTDLPKHGYTYETFEAEPPHDAEGEFRGHGYVGRWTLRSIQGCKGAVRFQAFAQPLQK